MSSVLRGDRPAPPAHLAEMDDLKLVAYVWYCGDDVCVCTQPVIAWQWTVPVNVGSVRKAYRREAIWEGTFLSRELGLQPDDPDPDDELRAECTRRGLGDLVAAAGLVLDEQPKEQP